MRKVKIANDFPFKLTVANVQIRRYEAEVEKFILPFQLPIEFTVPNQFSFLFARFPYERACNLDKLFSILTQTGAQLGKALLSDSRELTILLLCSTLEVYRARSTQLQRSRLEHDLPRAKIKVPPGHLPPTAMFQRKEKS